MLGAFWRKIKGLGVYDWLTVGLAVALGVGATVLVYSFVYDDSPNEFSALTYVNPVRVVDGAGNAPVAAEGEDTPIPSVVVGDSIPIELQRVMDCAAQDCPAEVLEIIIDVQFVQVDTKGNNVFATTHTENARSVLAEGFDYERGRLIVTGVGLEPFEMPHGMISRINDLDQAVTAWAIEGSTSPVTSAEDVPAAWRTEVFHVYSERPGE